MISNNLTICLAVVVTWWPALLPVQGMNYGSQGEGDVRRRLQARGPSFGVEQCDRPQPSQ